MSLSRCKGLFQSEYGSSSLVGLMPMTLTSSNRRFRKTAKIVLNVNASKSGDLRFTEKRIIFAPSFGKDLDVFSPNFTYAAKSKNVC